MSQPKNNHQQLFFGRKFFRDKFLNGILLVKSYLPKSSLAGQVRVRFRFRLGLELGLGLGQSQGQVRVRVRDRLELGWVRVRLGLGLGQGQVRVGLGLSLGQGQVRVRLELGQSQVRVRLGLGIGQGQIRVRLGLGQLRVMFLKYQKSQATLGTTASYVYILQTNILITEAVFSCKRSLYYSRHCLMGSLWARRQLIPTSQFSS